jgi:hypothetical protein
MNEEVELYINSANPDSVIVNTFTDRWIVIVVFGSIGLVFLLFTLGFAYGGGKVKTIAS